MKRIQLIPNLVTSISLACGLFVIFKINMIEPGAGTLPLLQMAVWLLLIASVADLLDGTLARLMHGESDFGFQFDSLSDAVTFAVAPAVVVLKTLSLDPLTAVSFWETAAALVYSICGVLRLVRFNVLTMRPKTEIEKKSQQKHFTGLPIPTAALAILSLKLFLSYSISQGWLSLSLETEGWIMAAAMAVIGYFMVSRWKFPSLKMLHFRVPSFQLVFIAVLLSLFLLYGVLYQFPILFFSFVWLYILTAWTIAIIRLIAGRRSKTLAEFEPEEESEEDE